MNRLTAIGLASLVAYGLLLATKYTGLVSAAREERPLSLATSETDTPAVSAVVPPQSEPYQRPVSMPAPMPRMQVTRGSPLAQDFRNSRDLKALADSLLARRSALSGDERYHLAKALEECQFATSINEDLAAYSAKQKRQFLAGLPNGDTNNVKRIAAYDAVDTTQRCLGFQNAKISPRDIEEQYRAAALQGDPRAQARLLTAELTKSNNNRNNIEPSQLAREQSDAFSQMIGLLESRDPESMMIVGEYLARSAQQTGLRVGPNQEVPEPSSFLGGFTLASCDFGQDCGAAHRDPLSACAYGGYCDAGSFEELYQNFIASPWAWAQASRYRELVHQAIETRNWALLGLVPPAANRGAPQ